MRLSDKNMSGRTIIAADGQVIGEITALFLDSDARRVESLQVMLCKDITDHLGAHRSVFRLFRDSCGLWMTARSSSHPLDHLNSGGMVAPA